MPGRLLLWLALLTVLAMLALLRPVDHDESQYVAAAVLGAQRLLPYRDFAYLQTPLQPLALAPVVALLGRWTWPGLRLVNALFAALAVAGVYGAARGGGVRQRGALVAAGLFASTDILLFAAGTARNDALPAACLAGALWLAMRPASRAGALVVGCLLAAAAAAKLSYALPAAAYGVASLVDPRRRPAAVLAGALPIVGLVAWSAHFAPAAFRFDVIDFAREAPAQFYAGSAKLALGGRIFAAAKFLLLGPALLALALVVRAGRGRRPGVLDALIVAGLLAGLLPAPTWRQYWLVMLPPLFVRLAMLWEERPPAGVVRAATALFAFVGLLESLSGAARGPGMWDAMREGAAIRTALDRAHVTGPVASLSPELLPATGRLPDPRFAAGPFYFRSHGLLDPQEEAQARLVSRDRLDAGLGVRPEAVLVGGEGPWSNGDDATLDAALAGWATAHGYRRAPIAGGPFVLYVRPR